MLQNIYDRLAPNTTPNVNVNVNVKVAETINKLEDDKRQSVIDAIEAVLVDMPTEESQAIVPLDEENKE